MKWITFDEQNFFSVIEGRKTQERYILKPQPKIPRMGDVLEDIKFLGRVIPPDFGIPPYKEGKTVYIREPFAVENGTVLYKWENRDLISNHSRDWENQMNMCEQHARYFIEIVSLRCERVQDISDDDCIKEGITRCNNGGRIDSYRDLCYSYNDYDYNYDTKREAYAEYFDGLNGKDQWKKNPYVWVYEFKLITKCI
jgi:hypothetical protein